MKSYIKFCRSCKKYTMKDICPVCKNETTRPDPQRFSENDKFQKYRIQIMESDGCGKNNS
ncbi:nucleolar RNA-binding Nop10p family protein [Caldiplasma sukawensis]